MFRRRPAIASSSAGLIVVGDGVPKAHPLIIREEKKVRAISRKKPTWQKRKNAVVKKKIARVTHNGNVRRRPVTPPVSHYPTLISHKSVATLAAPRPAVAAAAFQTTTKSQRAMIDEYFDS